MMNRQMTSSRVSACNARTAHRDGGSAALILSVMVMFAPLALIAMSIFCNLH